jgi:L-amino acid N-acyltransferase YncA
MNLIYEPMIEKYCNEVIDIFNYYVENSFTAYFENKLPYQFFNKFIEMAKGYPAYVLLNKGTKKVIIKEQNQLSK